MGASGRRRTGASGRRRTGVSGRQRTGASGRRSTGVGGGQDIVGLVNLGGFRLGDPRENGVKVLIVQLPVEVKGTDMADEVMEEGG